MRGLLDYELPVSRHGASSPHTSVVVNMGHVPGHKNSLQTHQEFVISDWESTFRPVESLESDTRWASNSSPATEHES